MNSRQITTHQNKNPEYLDDNTNISSSMSQQINDNTFHDVQIYI